MKFNFKKINYAGASALLIISMNSAAGNSAITQEQRNEADNSFIFVLQDSVSASNVPQIASDMAKQHAGTVRNTFKHVIKGFSANMSSQAAERLAASNPLISYYEKNGIAQASMQPTDKVSSKAGRVKTVAQSTPYGIKRVGGSRDGTGKHAWIIDTGIDSANADLNVGEGANFVKKGRNTSKDGNGHGTHVAGTIGAKDNAIDVVGVAANATVYPVRVLGNNGSGYIDWIVAGLDYVADHAKSGHVANISLGASGHFQSLHDAVLGLANKGILISIAAGNESQHANLSEPAHVEHPNVYTVSAIDNRDVFASFSNFGNPPIDFAAPGVGVTSNKRGGGVVTYSGTSMAAPHIAGLLLFATPSTSGTAFSDPDGSPDPIGYQ